MRVHYFQHVPFEGLGSIATWLEQRHAVVTATRFFTANPDPLPDPAKLDLLVVLGGPMSVNDESLYPWLGAEKQFIRTVIALDKPVLGICLGAQLLANVLGARVYPNAVKEIGWWPVTAMPDLPASACPFPAHLPVFHWHGETFDLPAGTLHLASSKACRNQAFQAGRSLGLQFHLETTPELAEALVQQCGEELIENQPFIQNATQLLGQDTRQYANINDLMTQVLEFMVQ